MKRQFWKKIIAGILTASVVMGTGSVSMAVKNGAMDEDYVESAEPIPNRDDKNSKEFQSIRNRLADIKFAAEEKVITIMISEEIIRVCEQIEISVEAAGGDPELSEVRQYSLRSSMNTHEDQRDDDRDDDRAHDEEDDTEIAVFPENGYYSMQIEMQKYGAYELSITGEDSDGDDRKIVTQKQIYLRQESDTAANTAIDSDKDADRDIDQNTDKKVSDETNKKSDTTVEYMVTAISEKKDIIIAIPAEELSEFSELTVALNGKSTSVNLHYVLNAADPKEDNENNTAGSVVRDMEEETVLNPESDGMYRIRISTKKSGLYFISIYGTRKDGKVEILANNKEVTVKAQRTGIIVVFTAVIVIIGAVVVVLMLIVKKLHKQKKKRASKTNSKKQYEFRVVEEKKDGWITGCLYFDEQGELKTRFLNGMSNARPSGQMQQILNRTELSVDEEENLIVKLDTRPEVKLTKENRVLRLNPEGHIGIDLIWIGARKHT